MKFKQLIADFCTAHALPPLQADEQGRFQLIADQYRSHCFCRGGRVFLQADLGVLPAGDYRQEVLLVNLLSAFWAHLSTTHETLSIDRENNSLSIHRQIPLTDLTLDAFEEAVACFFDTVEYCQGYIKQ